MCGFEDFEELGEDEQTAQKSSRTFSRMTPLPIAQTGLWQRPPRASAHAELPDDAMPGVAHPREQIVRNGLGDREPAVRAAAGKLVGAWVDLVSRRRNKERRDSRTSSCFSRHL